MRDCNLGSFVRRCFRRRVTVVALASIVFTVFLFTKVFPYAWIDFGYLARPIWDKEPAAFDQTVVHYQSEGLTIKERCHAHGWTFTPRTPPAGETAEPTENDTTAPAPAQAVVAHRKGKVYDAVIFSYELDMLEVRMRELYDVVDHFVVLESERTFTGLPKSAVFQQNRERFSFADSKIIYKLVPLRELHPGEEPWVNEGAMRDEMTVLLRSSGIKQDDYVIFSDVDEMPSRDTIELLSSCDGVPPTMHLNLHNYLYSFEFPVDDGGNWKPSFRRWPAEGIYYTRARASQILFAHAGWHCSFCFRTIEEFRFKLKAYSHADRLRYKYMLETNYLQDAICTGKDLFGMFPEAFSYKDLIHRLGPIPKTADAVGLPTWVIKNSDKFHFLLPGGCKRE
ncbi:hypothetical protein BGZ95_009532 [Linnemannia exigua]|uniref:Glycosyltransferase family 17 protein n=1 Tax=Linnemannia exigua TaxID=604196 RepID=A0AAD4HAY6_9FUNG|nr:hypothetical protein BGZ95_009532 [Linnemannia exigua]